MPEHKDYLQLIAAKTIPCPATVHQLDLPVRGCNVCGIVDGKGSGRVLVCGIPDCGKQLHTGGLCGTHVRRAKLGQDMYAPVTSTLPVKERFLTWVGPMLDGQCWEWQGSKNNKGYGCFSIENKLMLAHRVAYELFVGPIPEGLTIDHLCRNRICVNTEHLEPVPMRENWARGEANSAVSTRTGECQRGHPFDEANTYNRPNGKRTCIACRRMKERERRARA